jgi:hypothetical protein
VGSLENQRDLGVVIIIEGTNFSALVNALGSLERSRRLGNTAKLLSDQVKKFLVGFDTGGSNHNTIRTKILQLESLEGVGIEVINVGLETIQGHAEALKAIGCLKDFIRKMFTFI